MSTILQIHEEWLKERYQKSESLPNKIQQLSYQKNHSFLGHSLLHQ